MMPAVFSKHAIARLKRRFGVGEKVGQRWLEESREARALELLTTTHCRQHGRHTYRINTAKRAVFVLSPKVAYWLVLTCLRQLRRPARMKRKQRRELCEELPEAAR